MSLECTLDATSADGVVEFAFTVTNTGTDDVEMTFSDACLVDVAVLADGEERWRFSEGRMFAQMLVEETLAAGDSETFDVDWESPVPGGYEAVATLEANDADCEARTTFSV